MSEIKEKSKLIEIAIFYGIILAILRVSTDVTLKVLDVNSIVYYVGYIIGFILEIILVVLAIKAYKNSNNGLLSFVEAIKTGIILLVITGVAFYACQAFFDPEFPVRKVIEITEKYNPNELENVLEEIDKAKKNPKHLFSFAMNILYFTFIGFIISAIAGAVMKKTEGDEY